MEESFREFMDSCELTRYDQLETDFQKSDVFKKLEKEYDELSAQLTAGLTKSQLELLKQYEDVLNRIGIERGFSFYRHGFMDASELILIMTGSRKDINLNIAIV